MFSGTDETDSGVTVNAWAAYSGSAKMPDNTSTWYTTDDATFEITGLQLEVGSQATPFEHRSAGEELDLCKRYFYRWNRSGTNRYTYHGGYASHATSAFHEVDLSPEMRAAPTVGTWSDANVTSAAWTHLSSDMIQYIGTATQSASAARISSYVDFSAEL